MGNLFQHNQKIGEIFRNYNKQLAGSDPAGGNIFENILKYRPSFQSEILYIMFNAGYEEGIKKEKEKLKKREEKITCQ